MSVLEKVKGLFTGTVITVLLVMGLLTTGTINTVSRKFQNLTVSKGLGDGPYRSYEHPFFQTLTMFVGEFICLIAFYAFGLIYAIYQRISLVSHVEITTVHDDDSAGAASINSNSGKAEDDETQAFLDAQNSTSGGNTKASNYGSSEKGPAPVVAATSVSEANQSNTEMNPLIFITPALCDLMATTCQNVGLIYTNVSVFQMLRGTVVIINGIFSMIFLKNRLYPHNWVGMLLIATGIATVGSASIFFSERTSAARNPLLGNAFVVAGQALAASQYVIEEKFVSKYKAPPLKVVGYEGFFGMGMVTMMLFVLYWIPGSDYGSAESAPFAFAQLFSNPVLLVTTVISVLSIAFFNFFGIMITKRLSSTARSTIDASRTVIIWVISLIMKWEKFNWLQAIGFFILVSGTFTYNLIIPIPVYKPWYLAKKAEHDRLKKEQEEERIRAAIEKKRMKNANL